MLRKVGESDSSLNEDPKTGMWGGGIYSPKWISTTYTMLDLKKLEISSRHEANIDSAELLLKELWQVSDGKNCNQYLDLCIVGMILDLCCYAKLESNDFVDIIDYLIDIQLDDG